MIEDGKINATRLYRCLDRLLPRAREGGYLLRTNLPPGEPAQVWKSCIQLTEAEAAFCALQRRRTHCARL